MYNFKQLQEINIDVYHDIILNIIWVNNINYCFCWSWNNYTECCKWKTIAPHWLSDKIWKTCYYLYKRRDENHLREIEKHLNNTKCIIDWCYNKPCKSHLYPENIIRDNNWESIWAFEIDIFGRIRQIEKKPWEIWQRVRCSHHDNNLFKLTDTNTYSDSRSKRKKRLFWQELYNKIFWFEKTLQSRRLRVIYTLWLYESLHNNKEKLTNFITDLNFINDYLEYSYCCKEFDRSEFFRKKGETNPQLEYYCLSSNETFKCYGIFKLLYEKWIDYYIYLQPIEGKFMAHIFKLNRDIKTENDDKIIKIIRDKNVKGLLELLNNELPKDSKYYYKDDKKIVWMTRIKNDLYSIVRTSVGKTLNNKLDN